MTQAQTRVWYGSSGLGYLYEVYPIEDVPCLPPVHGNYIFAKGTTPEPGNAVYIGQAKDLRGRLNSHDKMPCAKKRGATHIHVHRNDAGEQARRSEEQYLIAAYNPPCNKEARRLEEDDTHGVSNAGGTGGGGGVPHDWRELNKKIREYENAGVSAPPEYYDALHKQSKERGIS